mgnify:CR=1 FL=1
MPQNTNLNISPYFDDFESDNNYQRVLFKPATPIQARELTTLQSILQNQIEKFGQHFFKEGAMVVPGQISYDSNYTCVEIDETHLGIPVSLYVNAMVGKKIRGEVSGVTAKVENFISNVTSERGNYTLYIKYQGSSNTNFSTSTFLDGENLIVEENVAYGVSSLREDTTFATTIISGSTSVGSAVKIESGVYFIRGFFVTVNPETVILDQYSNSPSYRVGLLINEELAVASNNYNDLYDNAQGFSNFSAPGADRLEVSVTLIKKEIDNFNDENFVELLRLENGGLQKFVKETDYNLIRDELAKRTYEESGDYYIKPYNISIKESLNNRVGNNGIYLENQETKQGNIPSDDLGCLQISPGKAYVKGYSVETISSSIIDFRKPRDTEKAENDSVPFSVGRQIIINNVYGSIPVGFDNTSIVELYDSRTVTPGSASGNKIGVARLYNLKLKNAEYINATTQYECSLYDIQTYTTITLNTSLSKPSSTFIEGKNSSASGYLVSDVVDGNVLTLYQVSGNFKDEEAIIIDGVDDGRVISNVRDYSLSDVHQLRTDNSGSSLGSFTADPVLSNKVNLADISAQFTITGESAGVSTVTTSSSSFYEGLYVGSIVSYTKEGNSVPTFNKVTEIDKTADIVKIQAVGTTSGINDGTLPGTSIVTNDFRKVTLEILNTSNAFLYTKLKHKNISSVDLSNAQSVIKKSYPITVSANAYSATLETDTSLTLEPFDEEDYNLTFISNGAIESLSNQKIQLSGRTVSLSNLSGNGSAILTVSYRKVNTTVKRKLYNRCNTLVINGSSSPASGIGNTTLDDGLSYSEYYGLRVQDKIISLNVPDVERILGIYESSTTSDPNLPKVTLTSLNSSVNNLLKGERLVGQTSGAVANFVGSDSVNTIDVVYINENRFSLNETIISDETNISGVVFSVVLGDKNIKNSFIFDNGQRSEYYDYSRIIRKSEISSPTKKIKIVYNQYSINSSDDGDFVSVDSYDSDRYSKNIPVIDGVRNTDIIDFRPRVSLFDASSATKSPFEYDSRLFSLSANSSNYVFAKDKNLNISYNYYLARIDKLFLTKDGAFVLNQGVPSLTPKAPNVIDSSLEIATIYYPPYVYDTKTIKTSLSSHKRYRMKDISRLEDRLSNVEYYSSLSLLETDTKNLLIRNPRTGLDKFKCGFFVDNFKSGFGGDISNPSYKASTDTAIGVVRPTHYTTSTGLILGSEAIIGIGQSSNPNIDLRHATDLGTNNLKRVGDLVMLNYNDEIYTKNQFATRAVNVNPFNIPVWIGSIELNPSTDTWIETRLTTRTEDVEGTYKNAIAQLGADTNTGLSPINWNSWETNWTGVTNLNSELTGTSTEVNSSSGNNVDTSTTTTTQFITDTFRQSTNQSRTGIQWQVSERFNNVSIGDKIISRSIVGFMRSRNVEMISRRLKPSTRFYSFFDNISMNDFVVPKLLEINMVSGTFIEGETVIGQMPVSILNNKGIVFRLAKQNHKYGPYNSPEEVYAENPYNSGNQLSSSYSSTTTILNVDTASLENQADSNFFGCISIGMQLIGETSNAIAEVSDIRLITDKSGTLIASLFFPDPTILSNPTFETGTKTLTLSTSSTNSLQPGVSESSAETNFTSSGTIDNVESLTLSIREADIERVAATPQNRSLTNDFSVDRTNTLVNTNTVRTEIVESTIIVTEIVRVPADPPIPTRWRDPLAQTFQVTDKIGIFITKCDVFFQSKDTSDIPVTLQLRTSSLGVPTQEVLPFSEVTLSPSDINISEDASAATTFTFPSPLFLGGIKDYALVLISDSAEYNVWISRMTEVDISTVNNADSEKILVSQQPTLGSLFKSQNGATWEQSQLEDLKFTLYRADFNSSSGSFRLYNPKLGIGNRQVASLRPNPIVASAKKVLVGLALSLSSSDITNLVPGITIRQSGYDNFYGKLESVVGSIGIGSVLSITNAGAAYTSNATYSDAPLLTLSGRGSGAKVDLTIENNVAVAATVSIGGTGYAKGDTLTVSPSETGGFGKNLVLSIPNGVGVISAFNSLIIDKVQDEVNTSGVSNEISYINSGGGISTISDGYVNYSEILTDGLYFKVNHNNHGMYSQQNKVTITGIEPDIAPEKLIVDYNQASTNSIQVNSVGIFTSFENLEVSPTNPGYIKINGEIIKYTSYELNTNTLTGITRGITDGQEDFLLPMVIPYHNVGSPVFKYEFNGISLRRINRTHSFADVDVNKYPISLDSYYVKLNTESNGTDRKFISPKLFFNDTKSGGTYDLDDSASGSNTISGPKATQNIQFDSIKPNIQTMIPEKTSISAKVRTFSGQSINGNEDTYVSKEFQSISLNSNNYLSTPSIIASSVNELEYLDDYLGNKSFTLELNLSTSDSKLSPVIDLDRIDMITTMNRIDSPVSNYKTDSRVNSLYDDPSSAIYISKVIRLERGSDSLKVYFDAYRDSSNELIVMYRILRPDTPDDQQLYELFPGFKNLDENGNVIDPKDNDGQSDAFVPASTSLDDFRSYEYTAENLPLFNGFQIKIIMAGTNQSFVPNIRDLRVIATLWFQ